MVALIEDDENLAIVLNYNLRAIGCHVDWIASGSDALSRLDKDPRFDLILLDWMLPGLSGIEILRKLRRSAAMSQVPIIMITADTDPFNRQRAYQTGATDFVTKPFSLSALLSRVQSLLDPAFRPPSEVANNGPSDADPLALACARRRDAPQSAVQPPSILMSAPVTMLDASEAR